MYSLFISSFLYHNYSLPLSHIFIYSPYKDGHIIRIFVAVLANDIVYASFENQHMKRAGMIVGNFEPFFDP